MKKEKEKAADSRSTTVTLSERELKYLRKVVSTSGLEADKGNVYLDVKRSLVFKLSDLEENSGNILERANQIINHDSEEKERAYGGFSNCVARTAKLATALLEKEIAPTDVVYVMVAMKLAREQNAHKTDNLLDAVAYLGGLNNMLEGR